MLQFIVVVYSFDKMLGVLLVVACISCASQSPGPPVIESVTPAGAPEGLTTTVTISGKYFYLGVAVNIGDKERPTLTKQFSVVFSR